MSFPSVVEVSKPFDNVPEGGAGVVFPVTGRSPIALVRSGVGHLDPTPTWEKTNWTKGGHMGKRKFAFAGKHEAAYTFPVGGAPRTFRTSDQTDEVNAEVMKIGEEVGKALAKVKADPRYSWVLAPLLPPHHNVASLHMSEEAIKGGALGVHSDDEPQHGSSLITSVSFGASAQFLLYPFGRSQLPRYEVQLRHGDVLYFDRHIPHAVSEVEGKRVNITFRTWNDAPWWRPEEGMKRAAAQEKRKERQERYGKRERGGDAAKPPPSSLPPSVTGAPPAPPSAIASSGPRPVQYRGWAGPQRGPSVNRAPDGRK